MKNIEFPIKRRVIIGKIPSIKKIINEDVQFSIDEFLDKKNIKQIKIELQKILFTYEWAGRCPNPLGLMWHHRLLIQMYIPYVFKDVCEEYLYKYWEVLNLNQRELLKKWSN